MWKVFEDKEQGKLYPVITNGDIYLSSCGTPVPNRWKDAETIAAFLNEEIPVSEMKGWYAIHYVQDCNANSRSGACITRDSWLNHLKPWEINKEMKQLFAELEQINDS